MSTTGLVSISTGGEVVDSKIKWKGQFGSIGDDDTAINISADFMRLIYRQCGYKASSTNDIPAEFRVLHVFNNSSFPHGASELDDSEIIILFGKDAGKAGKENKYDFPPPIDNDIFYGTLCLVKASVDDMDGETSLVATGLSSNDWEKIYIALFGGFYDCDDESDDESDDCEDEYAELPSTKNGYAKDGFVVDDDDSDGFGEGSDDEFCLTDED